MPGRVSTLLKPRWQRWRSSSSQPAQPKLQKSLKLIHDCTNQVYGAFRRFCRVETWAQLYREWVGIELTHFASLLWLLWARWSCHVSGFSPIAKTPVGPTKHIASQICIMVIEVFLTNCIAFARFLLWLMYSSRPRERGFREPSSTSTSFNSRARACERVPR